ncbi:MAG: hypothetical protein PHE55_22065 [Methylococcaceae bacterium]|nr:hypothetical protein [Methylococcaceae bacterium]
MAFPLNFKKSPMKQEDVMSDCKNFALLCLLGLLLTACGGEGPFGNNEGPKKPSWANQSPVKLFN